MTIVAANPGFELLCGCIEGGKVEVYAPRPILAWRITEYGPIPIALDVNVVGREMTAADYISMRLPEGWDPIAPVGRTAQSSTHLSVGTSTARKSGGNGCSHRRRSNGES